MLIWSDLPVSANLDLPISMNSVGMAYVMELRMLRSFAAGPPTEVDTTPPSIPAEERSPSGRDETTSESSNTAEQPQGSVSSARTPTSTLENAKLWRQWVDGKLGDRQRPPTGLTSYTPSAANAAQSSSRALRQPDPRSAPHFRPKDPSKDWKANSRSQRSAQDRIASLLVPEDGSGGSQPSGRYGVLGTAADAPRHVPGAAARAEEISPQRLLPHRLFYPGATYVPEDLDPYKAKPVEMMSDLIVKRGNVSRREVAAAADFRNPVLLNNFIGPSGKLEPRRRTRLPSKLHREMVRQVKLARALALMSPTAKVLPPRPLQRFNKKPEPSM